MRKRGGVGTRLPMHIASEPSARELAKGMRDGRLRHGAADAVGASAAIELVIATEAAAL